MLQRFTSLRWVALGLVAVLALAACGSGNGGTANAAECNGLPEQPTISFAAYSTPREAYGKIISAFKSDWKDEHDGQEVIFQESYDASTLQASRVVNGYEADVVALSLGPDVDEIADAGLITHDWTQEADGGMTTSVVVFDVRPGNPLGIEDWDDIAKPVWRSSPRPCIERRGSLEPRLRLGSGPPRPRRRHRGRRGGRHRAPAGCAG